ncbi:MAG: translation initiation factor IF-2 [Campylobacterota bacterium]|nr:translation initiation factor IF-2 [Campylobacterota bacterium]
MSDKVRVHEIAKELGIASKEVVDKAATIGVSVKTASSTVSMAEAEKIMNFIMSGAAPQPAKKKIVVKKAATAKTTSIEPKEEPITTPEVPTASEEKSSEKASQEVPAKPETKPTETKSEVAEVKETKGSAPAKNSTTKKKTSLIKEVTPSTIKRSGLKIVKKRKPKVEETFSTPKRGSEASRVSNYGKMSADVLEELASKKSRKKSQSAGNVQKKNQGKSLNIFGGGMSDVSMDYEEDQVVLLDLNEVDRVIPEEQAQKPRPKKPAGRNAGKKQGGPRKPRQVSRGKRQKYAKNKAVEEVVTHVEIPEDIRVYEFAEKLNRPMSDIIKVLFNLGMMATKNDFLGKDEIEILAEEFEVEVTTIDPKDAFNYEDSYEEDALDDENMQERPPIITIMGHVDHGKTSLLDAIRDAKVVDGEAGGITQHIGAYTINQHGKKITFIDTPGHAAFSNMRQRGAEVTDIIIIVVAADDGVKPQTLEVIKMAKESGAPVIIALNKMDKENANPDLVKGQMAEHGMSPIDWGGDTEFIPLSAKTGEGIDDLLENILTQAEILELRANPDVAAKAVVVESSLEKGRGPVATVIIQNGTLNVGDNVVCGASYGRVRALIDNHKKQIKTLGLSEAAVVVGLNEVPASGETLMVMDSDKEAREYAQKRYEYERHRELSHSTKTTLDELTSLIAEGNLKTLKVVLKTDVHGSLEAIKSSLLELRNEEVKVNIISSGVGGITETDVQLVNNSENCVLLGFNVRPTGSVKALAKQAGVEIRTYTIIYQIIDDITGMLTGMMSPKFTEEHTGQADVKEVFKIPKGVVAGSIVVDGKLVRGGLVRVIREGVVIHEGELNSLKRFKDDVKEIGNGYECGVVINGYEDVQPGDVIETFTKVEQKVSL